MNEFEKLVDGIYRLCIPFDNIYTSVFAVITESECVLLDSGSNSEDVENHILPALKKASFSPTWLISSHSHGDHNGGFKTLTSYFPDAKTSDFDCLCDCLRLIKTPGHTNDSLSLFDMRTKTILTFDSIQLYGIGKYGTGISDADEYLKTIDMLGKMDIENLIASHDYAPFGFSAFGSKNVKKYLDESASYIQRLRSFLEKNKALSISDIKELYDKENSNLPIVPFSTFEVLNRL